MAALLLVVFEAESVDWVKTGQSAFPELSCLETWFGDGALNEIHREPGAVAGLSPFLYYLIQEITTNDAAFKH
ncbi:MAG: hypothetical protein ACRD3F_06905 [Acidobacteriaceae bacterium]